MVILGTTMLGAFSGHTSAQLLIEEARETDLAIQILRSGMDRVLLESKSNLADPQGPYPAGRPLALAAVNALDDQVLRVSYPGYVQGDPEPAVLDVQVALQWRSAASGLTRTLSLSSSRR